MAERIAVPFAGEGSGVAGLTWGQRELWSGMCGQRTWMPIGGVTRLPAGTTVGSVVAELRFMMARYPSLRTRLRLPVGPDGVAGEPVQVLSADGEVVLEVVDTGGADPAEVAAAVRARYEADRYDFETDWPVRMAVVRHRGVLTHQVSVLCHLVADGFGTLAMLRDLAGPRPDPVPAGPGGATQPLEQARWQASPEGQRQSAASLRYWESLLWTVAPDRFPGSADPREPCQWELHLSSAALHLAVRVIAARTGLDSSPVLLGLFALALARVTGINPVVTRVVVSNRFRRGLTDTVSPVSQNGLCVIDVAGVTVDEAARRAARRAFVAYKHAYHDPWQMEELVDRVGRARGVTIDLSCYFNDRRFGGAAAETGPVPTAAAVTAARPATTVRWLGRYDHPERLFLHLNDASPSTVDISLFGNTRYLAPARLEELLRGLEDIAVDAAVAG
jgi:hypothetical protein